MPLTDDHRHPLVIDPVLVYSTFLGGIDVYGVPAATAVDQAGNAYVTGRTKSTNFPTQNPLSTGSALQGTGTYDVFVTKLNAAGNGLVFSTFLGAVVAKPAMPSPWAPTAMSTSPGRPGPGIFPILNPLPQGGGAKSGNNDVFVTAVDASGSALVYSSYLGGSYSEFAHGIAVDAAGCAYVTGETWSMDFPDVGNFGYKSDPYLTGFVAKIQPGGGGFYYSRYLKGTSDTETVIGYGIAADSAGRAT